LAPFPIGALATKKVVLGACGCAITLPLDPSDISAPHASMDKRIVEFMSVLP
jgi:hypothetical protein